MAYLYILELIDKTHYCGIARNVCKRIIQHQKGRSKSTRLKRPLVTKYIKEFDTIKEARIMEVRVKKQGVTRWYIKNQHRPDNLLHEIQQPTAACLDDSADG